MRPVTKRILNDFLFDLTHPSTTILNSYIKFISGYFHGKFNKSADYSSEIFFWERAYNQYFISKRYPEWWDQNLTKNCYSEEVRQILDILSRDFDEELKLIDVGSGPVTSFFNKLDITAWEIVTVDPLAKLYNDLNKKYGVNYSLICTEGAGECLDKLFDEHSFHLVLSQNAMDHATSPQEFINKLFYILKPKGFMYLSGFIKEGEAANYKGLHQHNLEIVRDHIFWTSRDKTANNQNITDGLNMELFYKKLEGSNTGDKFILVYKKN